MPTQEERRQKAGRIRSKRKALGLRQADLAKKAGVTVAMISKYEQGGSVFEMSASVESRLVQALQTNERWLNTGAGTDEAGTAMSEHEIALIDLYREMDDAHRKQIRELAEYMQSKSQTPDSK